MRLCSILLRHILCVCTLLLASCVTRQQITAELWINDGISVEECNRDPMVSRFGVYRVLSCTPDIPECSNGQKTYQEFISYCAPRIKTMLSADQAQVEAWLNQLSKPKP